ncbi:MAG: tyrosine-type recombinase/integrase, partial [Chitinophagaceae bacterium]|nr:tyrosine-type recombinase/integrase [Chitinophagaceae bacterium]
MTIPKHIDVFVKEMERRKYSETTIKSYSSNIGAFFKFFIEKEHPLHINESDIKNYLGTFSCPNTQRSHHGAIKKYYEICLRQKNKFKYIPYCRSEKKLPIVLSVQEVQRMFDVCENKKHKVILALLYSCSLRSSEVINLKWSNLDRSRKIINIVQGKGNKDRQVGLSKPLIKLLEDYYWEYRSVEYVLNGVVKGTRYSKRSILEVVKKAAQRAKINKDVWTHLMR